VDGDDAHDDILKSNRPFAQFRGAAGEKVRQNQIDTAARKEAEPEVVPDVVGQVRLEVPDDEIDAALRHGGADDCQDTGQGQNAGDAL